MVRNWYTEGHVVECSISMVKSLSRVNVKKMVVKMFS